MKRLILKKRKRTFFLKKCDHPPYTENRRPRVGLAGYGSAVLATTDGQTKGRCPTDTERKNKTSENTCLRSAVRRTPSFGLSGCRSEHALHIPPAPRTDAGFRPLSLDSTAPYILKCTRKRVKQNPPEPQSPHSAGFRRKFEK